MTCTTDHRFPEPREYQGWNIEYWAKPTPYRGDDYIASHPDYDGPEDNRIVSGATVSEVMNEIDLWIEENPTVARDLQRYCEGE